jgi:adenylyltransferase/sulfurtransferase
VVDQAQDDLMVPARYSRQVLFGGLAASGQRALIDATVVVVGCGGLGCMQATLLVRAGVGRVRIIDRDLVEESNLQRQVLFDETDAREMRPKAAAAAEKLRAANSLVAIEGLVEDLNSVSAARLLEGADVIVDATDNFDTRYLLNDYAVATGTSWVYGACVSSYGVAFAVLPRDTACLRCVFPEVPPPDAAASCDTAGVLGPIVGVVASLQVAEALKLLSGQPHLVNRRMAVVDVWTNELETVELPARDPQCPCCGKGDFEFLSSGRASETTSICGRNAVQVRARPGTSLDLETLAARLAPLGSVERNRFLLRAAIDNYELTVFPDGRAIVVGTDDPAIAKSVYARYVGT